MSSTILILTSILSVGAITAGGVCLAIRQRNGTTAESSPTYYTWGSNLLTGGVSTMLLTLVATYVYLQTRTLRKQLDYCIATPKANVAGGYEMGH